MMNHNINELKDYELAGESVLYKSVWYQPYYLSSGWVEFYPMTQADIVAVGELYDTLDKP